MRSFGQLTKKRQRFNPDQTTIIDGKRMTMEELWELMQIDFAYALGLINKHPEHTDQDDDDDQSEELPIASKESELDAKEDRIVRYSAMVQNGLPITFDQRRDQ